MPVRRGWSGAHVELEQGVARRQRHGLDVGDVPRRDDVSAGVGVGADRLHDPRDLVDAPAVRRGPRPPLVAVDRAQVAAWVGPLVPDRDAAVVQPADVRVAPQEPHELAEDRAQVQPLGRDDGEALGEVEAHLVAEDAARAGTCAVGLLDPRGEHVVEQVEVLTHARKVALRRQCDPRHTENGSNARADGICRDHSSLARRYPNPRAGSASPGARPERLTVGPLPLLA